MQECQAERVIKDGRTSTSVHLKRKIESDGQCISPRKVRFNLQIKESIGNRDPFIRSPVKNAEQFTESRDDRADYASFDGSALKDSNPTIHVDNSTTLDNIATTAIKKDQGITHTEISTSHMSTCSSTKSRSEISRVTKNDKKYDSQQEDVIKRNEFEQASGCNAPEDDIHYDKCSQCGKWIPHVTASLHEAVCEGQSLETKSQDHVSLSSASLENDSFREESNPDIQSQGKLLTNGDENEISICSGASRKDAIGEVNSDDSDLARIQDETCGTEKSLETPTALASTPTALASLISGKESANSAIINTSTVTSCESAGKMEENIVTELSSLTPEQHGQSLCSGNGDAGSTSFHEAEPTLEREESKERCTFCSTMLPVSELIHHASECSKMSAVPATDSSDTDNMQEACPYCGKYFDVLELVEHVTHCKDVCRIKAEEVSLEEDSPSSPEEGGSDTMDDPTASDRELCPKCRREFPLFELLNHATECKQEEPLSTDSDVESPREDANDLVDSHDADKDTKNIVGKESEVKDGTGDDVYVSCDNPDGEENTLNDDVCSSDNTYCDNDKRISETDHDNFDSGSAFDDVEGDEDCDDHGDEDDAVEDDKNDDDDDDDDDDSSRRDTDDDDVTCGDGDHDDDHTSDRSSISDGNSEDNAGDEKDLDDKHDELSTNTDSFSGSEGSDDECVDAVVNSEVDVGSDEFEFCPNCRKLFHLSLLVEHASNCISELSDINKAVGSAKGTTCEEGTSFDPPAESSVVFSDCHFCGIRLPVHIMSYHYPKCAKQHLEKSSSEGSSRSKERSPAGDFPLHASHIDNLSSRITVEDDRIAKRPVRSTKTTDSEESSSPSKNEVARFHDAAASASAAADDDDDDDDDRKVGESKVVLKRAPSSLDSYYDCEEQCMYCLKMFAVSVLVEHACNCTGRHESSADANELEQCCYCLQVFPLIDLINHAQNCEQKTISSSQVDSQDDVIANSQSSTGEVLERCMYCFKDFPVSKLIRHSQRCDGDMSGPRERFQGFLPSVHDLSAVSSVAILNDTQRAALQYVITRSAQDSKRVASNLLARVQRLGYSENDLKRTLQWVRSASPIIIHINLDTVLRFLVEDTHYRNRFETGTSGGSTDKVARKSWEDRIFNNAYHSSQPSERVKYGVLNIVGDPRGVRSCIHYGDSFLQLKKVRLRTTFASMDTSGAGVKLSCCEHYENVLFAYTDQEITAIMDVATGKVPFHRSDCISHYKEVQIHGPVSLSENVECIVVNSRHQKDPRTTTLLDRFVEQNKCNLIWMDPDDLTGAAPYFSSGHHELGLSRSLSDPFSRTTRRRRGRGHSRSGRKHPY